MGYWERVKDFFETAPTHELYVGALVTCSCHGGIALILELYDTPDTAQYPSMNMAKIWWIVPPSVVISREWMYTISRLRLYTGNNVDG